jgi:hypothetical protein
MRKKTRVRGREREIMTFRQRGRGPFNLAGVRISLMGPYTPNRVDE